MKFKLTVSIAALLLFGGCGNNNGGAEHKGEESSINVEKSAEISKGVVAKNEGVYAFNPKGNMTVLAGFGVYGESVATGGAGGVESAILSVGKVNSINDIKKVSSVDWGDSVPFIDGGGYIIKVKYKDETTYISFRLTKVAGDSIGYEYRELD